eukprot:9475480-Pyramimonas_sp.AAC.1
MLSPNVAARHTQVEPLSPCAGSSQRKGSRAPLPPHLLPFTSHPISHTSYTTSLNTFLLALMRGRSRADCCADDDWADYGME